MSVFALRSRQVVFPDGVRPATLLLAEGRIAEVLPYAAELACPVQDMGARAILPGVIDPHVHLNEPGRTHWEGFDTGTRAALAGGLTTLVDMPLNSAPVTTSVANLEIKRAATAGQLHTNVGFWGGIVPGNAADIEPLIAAGVPGFKVEVWNAMFAPKDTPAEIVERLNKELNAILADPAVKARIADIGASPFGGSAADFARFLVEDTERWGKVIREANIKAE